MDSVMVSPNIFINEFYNDDIVDYITNVNIPFVRDKINDFLFNQKFSKNKTLEKRTIENFKNLINCLNGHNVLINEYNTNSILNVWLEGIVKVNINENFDKYAYCWDFERNKFVEVSVYGEFEDKICKIIDEIEDSADIDEGDLENLYMIDLFIWGKGTPITILDNLDS